MFPRARAYLESLPRGAGSSLRGAEGWADVDVRSAFPACRAKQSLVPIALAESHVSADDLAGLGLGAFIEGTLVGAWMPEVAYVALNLGIADVRGYDDVEMREFWKRCSVRLIASPLYHAVFRFLSPRMVVTALGATWSRFHEGSTVSCEMEGARLIGTMTTPAGLHPPLIVEAYAGVLEAVVAHSKHFTGAVRVESVTPTAARYIVGDT